MPFPSLSPVDSFSPAIQRTTGLLFKPFRWNFYWRMAVVVADAGLGKVTVEETLRMINVQGLRIRAFNSKPEAMKWARDG